MINERFGNLVNKARAKLPEKERSPPPKKHKEEGKKKCGDVAFIKLYQLKILI